MVVAIIVIIALIVWIIAIYNNLTIGRNKVKNAFAQIDTVLQRRFDLIPNLVETVKGYAAHEQSVFENVTKARAGYMSAKTNAEKLEAENELTSTLKTLFAVAENYPELKSNQNFLKLQEDLKVTTGVQEYFYKHTYSNTPKVLKEGWDNIKECRSMIDGLVCASVMDTKIYFCSNMIEVLNNQVFNKYKHIELKEPTDYVSVSKINSIKDLIPYLKGCYSLCHYCNAILTPWSTSIKVKQI